MDSALVLNEEFNRAVVPVAFVFTEDAGDIPCQQAVLKVAETSSDGVSASDSSGWDLCVSQAKAVGIHGDISGRVEVGYFSD